MRVVAYYAQACKELKICEERLKILIEIKENIDTKYLSVTINTNQLHLQSNYKKEKYIDYLYNKENVVMQITVVCEEIKRLKKYILGIEKSLKMLNQREYLLFYAIVVENIPVTRAVEYTACKTGKSVSTIWRIYKKSVMEYIKNL